MTETVVPRLDLTISVSAAGLTVDELDELVRMVTAAASGVKYEISMAVPASLPDDPEGAKLEWLESVPGGRISTHESSIDLWTCGLNGAVAAGSADIALIVEPGMHLPPRSVARLLCEWERTSSDWLSVPVRAVSGGGEHVDSNIGAILCRRDDFLRLRGYDERAYMTEVASSDLRERLHRAGLASRQAPAGTHIVTATAQSGALSADEVRKRIAHDSSIYRNLTQWSVPHALRPPLVSVAIATRDRSGYLLDSINSVLNQTFSDFEIIVVDDGSTDDTRTVVESVEDQRVRYIAQEPQGISAARNRAADESKGFFTAVHDDDDIMLPDRLEVSLRSLTEEYDASYGSWVNFDDSTADMVLHVVRDQFNPDLVAFNGQGPGHSTWLVPTEMVRQVRYDETYSASVDHNIATRMAWNGCRWVHTGRVAYLRRIHSSQVSITSGSDQKIGHVLTRYANEFVASDSGRAAMRAAGGKHVNPDVPGKRDLVASFAGWLPDHLVHRSVVFRGNVSNKVMKLGRYSAVSLMLTERDFDSGRLFAEVGHADGITWEDLVRMRVRGGVDYELSAVLIPGSPDSSAELHTSLNDTVRTHLDRVVETYSQYRAAVWLFAIGGLPDSERRLFADAQRRTRIVAASEERRVTVDVFGYKDRAHVPVGTGELAEMVASGRIVVVDPAAKTPFGAAVSAASVVREC